MTVWDPHDPDGHNDGTNPAKRSTGDTPDRVETLPTVHEVTRQARTRDLLGGGGVLHDDEVVKRHVIVNGRVEVDFVGGGAPMATPSTNPQHTDETSVTRDARKIPPATPEEDEAFRDAEYLLRLRQRKTRPMS